MKTPLQYYQERMKELGINESMHSIELYYDSHQNSNFHKLKNKLKQYQIFEPNEKGIGILLYSIESEVQWFRTQGGQKSKEYRQTRLLHPKGKLDGSIQKYDIPKGQKVLPFFPPKLIDKYKEGILVDILYLTEGHFKAFKASMHGIDCVGIPSITCLKDGEGKIHSDIIKLIRKCQVQKLVWLMDGDCRNLSGKKVEPNTNITLRPYIFYKSVETFQDLLLSENIRLYFAHINSDELEKNPKGLDDLLCSLSEKKLPIAIQEFNDFSIQKSGFYAGQFITRFEITRSLKAVFRYFLLHDVDEFYQHHSVKNPEIEFAPFKFFGTSYQYDMGSQKCKMLVPKGAANYFRVGDSYYQYIAIPDEWNNLMHTFERREKKTIQDDNDKDIFKHIPKYLAFCNVPSHTNYQQIIHNCYNLYHPFEWEPNDELDCSYTLNFIKHIFGTEKVQLFEEDSETFVERWELGLDYLQILYQKPQQMLPILSLVSIERQTGKTTFGDWLKELYKENMAIVGNNDLKNDFNSFWISKLVVMVDETKINTDIVLEKLKSLSTAKTAIMNSKGKDQKSIRIFTKFILNSNREEHFIKIDKEEIRFWVIKVPPIPKAEIEMNIIQKLVLEIPSFIYFLNKRKIKAPPKERHWFETRLLMTDALKNVIAHSKITLEKQIEIALSELFDISGEELITLPLKEIADIVKFQNNKSYVSEVLQKKMQIKPSDVPSSKQFPRIVERRLSNTEINIECEYVRFKGRYYTFRKDDFQMGE